MIDSTSHVALHRRVFQRKSFFFSGRCMRAAEAKFVLMLIFRVSVLRQKLFVGVFPCHQFNSALSCCAIQMNDCCGRNIWQDCQFVSAHVFLEQWENSLTNLEIMRRVFGHGVQHLYNYWIQLDEADWGLVHMLKDCLPPTTLRSEAGSAWRMARGDQPVSTKKAENLDLVRLLGKSSHDLQSRNGCRP